MVDIHCHILPGIDDGPDSLEEALQMAEMAIADGITHVVATPHANATFPFDADLVRRRCDELQARLGDRLALATGCDFHLSFENLERVHAAPPRYTINQKNYLLIEFAEFAIPPGVEEALHRLQLAGLHPVITHPERNALILSSPERLGGWLRQGCFLQVTAQAVLGRFGPVALRAAQTWLEQDRIHFFASDAHNLTSRPLRMREAYQIVAARRGEEIAQALFHDNPLAALEGRSLPYLPEPPAKAAERAFAGARRKRFFFF